MAKKTSLRSAAKQKTETDDSPPVIKKPALADNMLTKRINAEIPLELHNRFKAKCAVDGREMKEVLIEMIEGYLDS